MNVAFLGMAGLLAAAALYWLLGRRAPRPTGARATGTLLGSLALAFACHAPLGENASETVVPHLAQFLRDCASLTAATALVALSLQRNLGTVPARRHLRLRLALLAVTVCAMTALFGYEQISHGPAQAQAPYTLLFVSQLGFTTADFLLQAVRQSRSNRRVSVRAGLRTAAAGCVLALAYVAYRLTVLISPGLGVRLAPDGSTCSSLVAAPCVFPVTSPALAGLLFCLGLALPAIAYPVSQLRCWRWELRSYEALGALWRDVTDAVPEVALPPLCSADHDSHLLLQRRVVEISDGLLALRPYRSRTVQEAALRIFDTTCEVGNAGVEAAVVNAALAARDAGEFPDEAAPPFPGAGPRTDRRADTEWLLLVAAAYAAHPGRGAGTRRPEPVAH
ncbi:MAB_1171c family putative transporter [Streptomyces sp. HSW2009]|uniref:MAB_1171c family putative transporter n=1 Tax=Streptomyces sp. HSW2009 TaxID=3142890 RepID=UPI0032EC66B9